MKLFCEKGILNVLGFATIFLHSKLSILLPKLSHTASHHETLKWLPVSISKTQSSCSHLQDMTGSDIYSLSYLLHSTHTCHLAMRLQPQIPCPGNSLCLRQVSPDIYVAVPSWCSGLCSNYSFWVRPFFTIHREPHTPITLICFIFLCGTYCHLT